MYVYSHDRFRGSPQRSSPEEVGRAALIGHWVSLLVGNPLSRSLLPWTAQWLPRLSGYTTRGGLSNDQHKALRMAKHCLWWVVAEALVSSSAFRQVVTHLAVTCENLF